ncbi:MAG: AI-2E family transporter [Candidatus Hydrogenedentales bacterium]
MGQLDPVFKNPWVRAAALVAAIVLVVILAILLKPVLVPLFFAFLVAYVLDPVVDIFERRKIPRGITISMLAITGIVAALAIPLLFVPSLIQQAEQVMVSVEADDEGRGTWSRWAHGVAERLPLEYLLEATGCVEDDEPVDNELGLLTECFAAKIREQAILFIKSHGLALATAGRDAGRNAAQILSSIGNSVLQVLLFIANFALFAFVAAYLLRDYDRITAASGELIPYRHRPRVTETMKKIDFQLRSFLRGQFVVMICLGLMYAIGLSIAQVPFALLIALFGAFASFVPYLGLILTIGPAVLLCLQVHGVDWHVVAVLATFGLAQFLEGTVLTPRIVGEQVGLGPVWVILAVLVFGSWLGFLGLLLAVPIAAVLKVLVVEGLATYRETDFYRGGGRLL